MSRQDLFTTVNTTASAASRGNVLVRPFMEDGVSRQAHIGLYQYYDILLFIKKWARDSWSIGARFSLLTNLLRPVRSHNFFSYFIFLNFLSFSQLCSTLFSLIHK